MQFRISKNLLLLGFVCWANLLAMLLLTASVDAKTGGTETVKDAESLLPVSPKVPATSSRTVPEGVEAVTPAVIEAEASAIMVPQPKTEIGVAIPLEPFAVTELKIDRRLSALALLRERPWPERVSEEPVAPPKDLSEEAKPLMAIADSLSDETERRRVDEAVQEDQFLRRGGELV